MLVWHPLCCLTSVNLVVNHENAYDPMCKLALILQYFAV